MLDRIFDGSLMPHGHCLLWRWDLLFLHLGGDLLTTVAYALIPFGIFYFLRQRNDLNFNGLAILFAAFIAFCGASHLAGLINVWHGYYFIEGVIKFLTGIVSIVTAICLWRMMPLFVKIPSIDMLKQRNEELEALRTELEESNKSLEQKVKQRTAALERQANTDTVTDVASRFAIMDKLNHSYLEYQRYQRPFSILMIDIDHFKDVNDTHGHQTGDHVLHDLAMCIASSIRKSDSVGRYGGEEFLVILPETPTTQAHELANRIRVAVEKITFTNDITITCSIGIATMTEDLSDDGLVSQADKALYKAKNSGRNQVISYADNMAGDFLR